MSAIGDNHAINYSLDNLGITVSTYISEHFKTV